MRIADCRKRILLQRYSFLAVTTQPIISISRPNEIADVGYQVSIRNWRCLIRSLAFSLLAFPTLATAETPAISFPAQAKPVEGIVVPVPKEVFRTLDEFHAANWRAVQRPEIVRWKSRGDQVQIALLLGNVVAEGFFAMEAEDSNAVRKIGKKVLMLARALGVEHAVLRRSRSIIDCTDRGDWSAARKEWDGVLSDLEQEMIALESKPILQLVSLSGWLRGTEGLSVLLLQDYSPDRAEIIRQPAMCDYFEEQLLVMPERRRNHPMIVKMLEGLRKVRSLCELENGVVPQQKIKEIGRVCRDLVGLPSRR